MSIIDVQACLVADRSFVDYNTAPDSRVGDGLCILCPVALREGSPNFQPQGRCQPSPPYRRQGCVCRCWSPAFDHRVRTIVSLARVCSDRGCRFLPLAARISTQTLAFAADSHGTERCARRAKRRARGKIFYLIFDVSVKLTNRVKACAKIWGLS